MGKFAQKLEAGDGGPNPVRDNILNRLNESQAGRLNRYRIKLTEQ